MEDLATDLEVVIAAPPALEVIERAEHLVAAPLAGPIAIAAENVVVARVFVAEAGAIHPVVPVIPVLTAADFGERVVAEHAVPFTFVHPGPEVLVPRRRFRQVDAGVD